MGRSYWKKSHSSKNRFRMLFGYTSLLLRTYRKLEYINNFWFTLSRRRIVIRGVFFLNKTNPLFGESSSFLHFNDVTAVLVSWSPKRCTYIPTWRNDWKRWRAGSRKPLGCCLIYFILGYFRFAEVSGRFANFKIWTNRRKKSRRYINFVSKY